MSDSSEEQPDAPERDVLWCQGEVQYGGYTAQHSPNTSALTCVNVLVQFDVAQ